MTAIEQQDPYVLGRGVSEAIRLDAQHLLWRMHLGHVLDSQVPVKDGMKIAELGTGTGTWLFDVARSLPSTVQLYGFDISADQFPAKELWPQNVQLGVLDSLVDPPYEHFEQYDVVHVRMWASNLRENNTTPLIQHIKKLLKPGGYLQWEDADLIHQEIKGTDASHFTVMMQEIFKQAGLYYGWVAELPTRLLLQGFEIKRASNTRFANDLKQLCTITYLLAVGEILQGIKKNSDAQIPISIMEHEKALHQLLPHCRDGMIYNWTPISMLCQKSDAESNFVEFC